MVSFLSFFSSKKKSKKPSPRSSSPPGVGSGLTSSGSALGSPSPKRNEPPRTDSKGSSTSSAVRASNGGKFLSLSSRSASKPYDLAQRRASSEVGRSGKRSGGSSTFRRQASANGTTAVPVPKLDLAWELPGEDERDLGFSDVGVRPRLTDDERRALDGLKMGVEEVKEAWTWFGNQLRQTGVDSPGILLPRRPDADVESQLYLLALFVLAIRPSYVTSFPSVIAHFPSSSPSPDSPDLWRDRLLFALKDLHSVPDLCECLKWTLRHLVMDPNSSAPLIDAAVYTSFVQNEHASSYPKDGYHTIFLPRLSTPTAQLLEEVFEVCATIATHADTNGMSAGRVCLFLGWWLQGPRKSVGTWEELYNDWKEAGRRTEHLFYAWVRYQSTKGKIPTRLLDLVEDYPFGESSASSEHLPLPPPSSFSRTSLHVTLSSDVPLDKVSLSLRDLANAGLNAPIAEEGTAATIWREVRGSVDGEGDDIFADVFSVESRGFLSSINETEVNPANGSPAGPPAGRSPNGSTLSTPKRTHSRKRSQSHGAITSSLDTPSPKFPRPSLDVLSEELAHLPSINGKNDGPSRVLTKQTSTGMLRSSATPASWDDFISAGFADAAEQRDLSLALSTSSTFDSLSSVGPATPSVENGKPITKRPSTLAQFSSSANAANVHYVVVGEETLEIDDVFMGFVEEGQLDASVSSKWPRFTLVRLATPPPTDDPSKPIEWLLITLDYRPPAPIVPTIREVAPTERSISPSVSTSSRFGSAFGLSSIAGGFKRSSSFGQNGSFRKSIFGGSKRSNSRTGRGEGLSTLAEGTTIVDGATVSTSAAQAAPTKYAIGEMGEIVKLSSANANPVEANSTTLAGDPPAAVDPEPTIVIGDLPGPQDDPGVSMDPSAETAASDWSYIGEGGAHVLFAYHGLVASWKNRVLRIRKRQANPDDNAQQALWKWRSELLPRLLPTADLLLQQKVHVEGSWLRQVVDAAKGERSEGRIAENALEELEELGDVSVMDNAIGSASTPGTRTLALEIKPKWGFLPSARFLQPPESVDIKTHYCRFCMHQGLRRPESGEGPQYCPLDLYSGDPTRMREALDALWGAWRESGGANNNWRVFVDGKVVLPEDADLIPAAEDGPLSSMTSPFVLPLLQSSGVLNRLRALQSTLDPTDISDLVARFRKAHEGSKVFDPTLVPEPTADELQEVVPLYLSNPSRGFEDDGWTLRQRLVLYALSAIFKDCSIIVRAVLRPAEDGEHFVLDEQESDVRVIDLDLKPMASLRKWAELDDKIWRNQLAAGTGTGEVCVDSKSAPSAQGKEPEREADVNDQDGRHQIRDENGLAVPLKPKALTNLSLMSGGLDNASTTAVFMPTPETSVYGTPRSGSINEEARAEIVETATHGDVAKDGGHAEEVKGPGDLEQGVAASHEAAVAAVGTAGAIAGIATTAAVFAHKGDHEQPDVGIPALETRQAEATQPSTVSEQPVPEEPEKDTIAAIPSSRPAEDIAVAPPAEAKAEPADTVSTIETSAPSSPVVSRRERSPGPSPSPTRGEYLEEAPVDHEEDPVEHKEVPVIAGEATADEKVEAPLAATLPRSEQEVPLTSTEETALGAVHLPSHEVVETTPAADQGAKAAPAVSLSQPESATEPESPAVPPLVVPQPERPTDKSIIAPSEAPTPSLVSDVPTPPSSSSPPTILRPRTYEEAALEIAGFPPRDIAESSQSPETGIDASASSDPGVIPERGETTSSTVDETQHLPRQAAMTAPREAIGVGEVSLADVQASLADGPAVAEEALTQAPAMLVEQEGQPRVIPVEDLPPIYNPPEEPQEMGPRAQDIQAENATPPPPPTLAPLGCQMPVNALQDHGTSAAAVTLPDPEHVEPPRVIAGHAQPTATAIMAAAGPAEAVQQTGEGTNKEVDEAEATSADLEQVEPPRVIAGHARPTATAIMAAAGPAEAVQQIGEGSKEGEAEAEVSETSAGPESAKGA